MCAMKVHRWVFAIVLAGTLGAGMDAFAQVGDAMRGTPSGSLRLPVEGGLPDFSGATAWLNSPPLTAQDLKSKVVVIDVWTYTCINWLRSLPYVRAWADKYRTQGLVVIGVHSPEFPFEKDVDNVTRAARAMRVDYPIAVDSDFAIWRALDNHYWPALYIVDAQGRIRYHQFGEGEYERSEQVIQTLLAESGGGAVDRAVVTVAGRGAEAAADWDHLRSPENYLGAARTERFASPGGAALDRAHDYAAPPQLKLNQWALAGNWTVRPESAILNAPRGSIAYRFHARDVHLVMGPAARGATVRFRVSIDGQPPGTARGDDVDAQGNGMLSEPRLYQLIRQRQPIGDRRFEIEFLDPGVEAFAFTFG
jgi:thiol-disulfide isomerase/thioredoxin